jgi:hypothetical protein
VPEVDRWIFTLLSVSACSTPTSHPETLTMRMAAPAPDASTMAACLCPAKPALSTGSPRCATPARSQPPPVSRAAAPIHATGQASPADRSELALTISMYPSPSLRRLSRGREHTSWRKARARPPLQRSRRSRARQRREGTTSACTLLPAGRPPAPLGRQRRLSKDE